jgi:hypothetical protein
MIFEPSVIQAHPIYDVNVKPKFVDSFIDFEKGLYQSAMQNVASQPVKLIGLNSIAEDQGSVGHSGLSTIPPSDVTAKAGE